MKKTENKFSVSINTGAVDRIVEEMRVDMLKAGLTKEQTDGIFQQAHDQYRTCRDAGNYWDHVKRCAEQALAALPRCEECKRVVQYEDAPVCPECRKGEVKVEVEGVVNEGVNPVHPTKPWRKEVGQFSFQFDHADGGVSTYCAPVFIEAEAMYEQAHKILTRVVEAGDNLKLAELVMKFFGQE